MGIIENELANFELNSGENITIELNESGSIHVHIDNIRIGCSQEEFCQVVDCISDGRERLLEVKDIHGN